MGKPTPPLLGDGLVTRAIEVRPADVVLVRGYLEASEGLGLLFAERGGDLVLATTPSQAARLDEFIADLREEMPVWERATPPETPAPGG